MPTLYQVIGITPPMELELNRVEQKPIEGISFADTFDNANAKGYRTTQYFELGSNRGLYHDGWMASALSFRRGNRGVRVLIPTNRNGNATTSIRASRKPTTWPRITRKSCVSCRTYSGQRPPSTMSCRWTGEQSNG